MCTPALEVPNGYVVFSFTDWRSADWIVVELAGPEVASASLVWSHFFTHCRDAQMVLERWPCLMSKDELKDLAPSIVAWSDGKVHSNNKSSSDRTASGYKSLEVGSEAWLEIPIVTGDTELGEVLVLACVKHCLPEVHNAA